MENGYSKVKINLGIDPVSSSWETVRRAQCRQTQRRDEKREHIRCEQFRNHFKAFMFESRETRKREKVLISAPTSVLTH